MVPQIKQKKAWPKKMGCLKKCVLKPLYKKGSKANPTNFRPISILPIVSKIIMTIIHDQNMKYLYQLG